MDWVVFVAAALAVLVGAFGVILSSNPVHSALMLVMTLFGVAVLFVAQQADFLAAVQVIVYAGAIVVLFLFVIMLLGVDRSENLAVEPLRGQRVAAAIAGLLALGEVLFLAGSAWATGTHSSAGMASGPGSNVEKLAQSLFTRYLLAFEATSVLLVIAVVGAVVLAQRNRADDASLAPPLRSGTEPPLRSGTEPALRSGTEPALRSGTEPALRSGTEPSEQSTAGAA